MSSSETLSINNIINVIREIVGEDFEIEYVKMRGSDNTIIDLDNTKLTSFLGDYEQISIKKGISRTFAYITNSNN